MSVKYPKILKKQLCENICLNGNSTLKTADDYGIPIKTLEKWITAFNKNNHCFDSDDNPNDFKSLSPICPNILYNVFSEIDKYIHYFNYERPQAALNYLTPIQFKQLHTNF